MNYRGFITGIFLIFVSTSAFGHPGGYAHIHDVDRVKMQQQSIDKMQQQSTDVEEEEEELQAEDTSPAG